MTADTAPLPEERNKDGVMHPAAPDNKNNDNGASEVIVARPDLTEAEADDSSASASEERPHHSGSDSDAEISPPKAGCFHCKTHPESSCLCIITSIAAGTATPVSAASEVLAAANQPLKSLALAMDSSQLVEKPQQQAIKTEEFIAAEKLAQPPSPRQAYPETTPQTPTIAPTKEAAPSPTTCTTITMNNSTHNESINSSNNSNNNGHTHKLVLAPQTPEETTSQHHQQKVTSNILPKDKRRVRFSHVCIRNYRTTIGDNPCCSYGPPLTLDWVYNETDETGQPLTNLPLYVYEGSRPGHAQSKSPSHKRKTALMILNSTQRCARLFQAGHTMEDMKNATEAMKRERFRRSRQSVDILDPIYWVQELWLFKIKPKLVKAEEQDTEAFQRRMERELRRIERKVRDEHSQSQGLSQRSLMGSKMADEEASISSLDSNAGVVIEGLLDVNRDLEEGHEKGCSGSHGSGSCHNVIRIENMDGLSTSRASLSNHSFSWHRSDCSSCEGDSDAADATRTSNSSSESTYGIDVDRKQQDKATEIKLYSLRRPHMRAFHASWFSFFVAFFCWFSITPLLGEVKTTLKLTNDEIWISSLMGTAGTMVMRIFMGPLCDKFGARLCMACILITSAIPTAFTGLINDAAGLNLVRLFIGIGGSSFVACQYWTSDMFTRDVAGTANALAAGWGNLGGGVANVFIGSVLFPLFRFIYEEAGYVNEDDVDIITDGETTSQEMAWRSVFVMPAILAMATGISIIFTCDDSPLGSYRDRIKNERLTVVTPIGSLCSAAKNWNVWILAVQYACCFGVEVTMTNATALYFKDEFGQSTVSAAAIASIFGIMNIFARGFGGWCSDWFQHVGGVRGRLAWQMICFVAEGSMIVVFGYIHDLAGAIVALIFLSITVQSAEGSTFGIVPYIERRFTGSVVGIVGSGGNLGAVIFSLFFVYYSYEGAFIIMGLFAGASALLCFFLNTKMIAQMQETLDIEVSGRVSLLGDGEEGGTATPMSSNHNLGTLITEIDDHNPSETQEWSS